MYRQKGIRNPGLSSTHTLLGFSRVVVPSGVLGGGRGDPGTKLLYCFQTPARSILTPLALVSNVLPLWPYTDGTSFILRLAKVLVFGHQFAASTYGLSYPQHHYSHNTHSGTFIEKICCRKLYYFKCILYLPKLTSEKKIGNAI